VGAKEGEHQLGQLRPQAWELPGLAGQDQLLDPRDNGARDRWLKRRPRLGDVGAADDGKPQHAAVAVEPGVVAGRHRLARRGGLKDDQPGEARLGGKQIQSRPQGGTDPLGRTQSGVALKSEDAEKSLLGDLVSGGKALLLVGKLLIESIAPNLREPDDLLDGRSRKAVLGNRAGQGREQPLPLIGRHGAGHDCLGPAGERRLC